MREHEQAGDPDHEVVVIGAGPGGIAAAVTLRRSGTRHLAILERADAVGGSWRDNRYPGVGVDVPSLASQYSFARKARRRSTGFPLGDYRFMSARCARSRPGAVREIA